jgi:taurine dioxygenase
MNYEHITVQPVAGALGAEVGGVDLSEPVSDVVAKEIRSAWMDHQVLFLRDQDITIDQHKAFARQFGDLHIHPVLHPLEDQGHPEIVVLESDAKRRFLASGWHSDVTFEKCPPMGSILRGLIVPDRGGDTTWASMFAAYEGLSDQMQRVLSSLEAFHDGGGFKRIANEEQAEELERRQTATHPVIRTHPESGRKAIFVNSAFTKHIVGMKPAESEALLRFLYKHLSELDYTCRLSWKPNTIAMWDNRCTQHRVVADNVDAHRLMHRVTLLGDAPYYEA